MGVDEGKMWIKHALELYWSGLLWYFQESEAVVR